MSRTAAWTALLLGLALAAAAQAQPTVSTPAMACRWCDTTVTWSGHPSPSSSNRLVVTAPGVAGTVNWSNGSVVAWRFTSAAASGTLPLNIPGSTPYGNYVVHLTGSNGATILATSAPFQVTPFVAGTVTSGGSPLAGVNIAFPSSAVCNPVTDASGHWGCIVPYGWSGTITVSKPGNLFSPASRSYTNVTIHANNNDFATLTTPTVAGTIIYEGSPLSGAAIAGSNGASCTSTNASGQYTCAVPSGWSGTVTPSMADRVFTPASRSYTNVTAAQSAQGYTANATFYQVSGAVTLNGLALPNVAVAATGGHTCTSTSGAGQYSCTVPFNWSGSVTPAATGYSFGPASRSYTSVSSQQTAQTFTATLDTPAAPIYFVHVDHLNTPRLVSDSTGTAVWKWDQQEPFGVSPADKNPSGLGVFDFPLRHAGQYDDPETGLFYNYLRDCYDPVLGRYCQADPIGLAGGDLSLYAYVGSNPLSFIDPLGLATTIPGPGGIPVPVPVPPAGTPPGQQPGGSGLPPGLDPNQPRPKTFPIIKVPPFPPSSPPPQGGSICQHLFNVCIKGAEICPPPITQVGRAFCLAGYIICITISGSGGSGGNPAGAP